MPNTPTDACTLLDTDHKNVKKMFETYESLNSSKAQDVHARKLALARHICLELTVHTQIEEEIFYPALRGQIRDEDLLDEANVEHQSAKDLIAQIEQAADVDDMFDARVKVLGEYIDHHVKEERNELFPQARDSGVDLVSLGELLRLRKADLMEEQTAEA
jgi:hemerythrin-like domain-containing protein